MKQKTNICKKTALIMAGFIFAISITALIVAAPANAQSVTPEGDNSYLGGIGTDFSLDDVSINSSIPIYGSMSEARYNFVLFNVQRAPGASADSTFLTITGLIPDTSYNVHEDGFVPLVYTSDSTGEINFNQDIGTPHTLTIKTDSSIFEITADSTCGDVEAFGGVCDDSGPELNVTMPASCMINDSVWIHDFSGNIYFNDCTITAKPGYGIALYLTNVSGIMRDVKVKAARTGIAFGAGTKYLYIENVEVTPTIGDGLERIGFNFVGQDVEEIAVYDYVCNFFELPSDVNKGDICVLAQDGQSKIDFALGTISYSDRGFIFENSTFSSSEIQIVNTQIYLNYSESIGLSLRRANIIKSTNNNYLSYPGNDIPFYKAIEIKDVPFGVSVNDFISISDRFGLCQYGATVENGSNINFISPHEDQETSAQIAGIVAIDSENVNIVGTAAEPSLFYPKIFANAFEYENTTGIVGNYMNATSTGRDQTIFRTDEGNIILSTDIGYYDAAVEISEGVLPPEISHLSDDSIRIRNIGDDIDILFYDTYGVPIAQARLHPGTEFMVFHNEDGGVTVVNTNLGSEVTVFRLYDDPGWFVGASPIGTVISMPGDVMSFNSGNSVYVKNEAGNWDLELYDSNSNWVMNVPMSQGDHVMVEGNVDGSTSLTNVNTSAQDVYAIEWVESAGMLTLDQNETLSAISGVDVVNVNVADGAIDLDILDVGSQIAIAKTVLAQGSQASLAVNTAGGTELVNLGTGVFDIIIDDLAQFSLESTEGAVFSGTVKKDITPIYGNFDIEFLDSQDTVARVIMNDPTQTARLQRDPEGYANVQNISQTEITVEGYDTARISRSRLGYGDTIGFKRGSLQLKDTLGSFDVEYIALNGGIVGVTTLQNFEKMNLTHVGQTDVQVENIGTVSFDILNLFTNQTETVISGQTTVVIPGPTGQIEAKVKGGHPKKALEYATVKTYNKNDSCVSEYFPNAGQVNEFCEPVAMCVTGADGKCLMTVLAEEHYFVLSEHEDYLGDYSSHSVGKVTENKTKKATLVF